MLKLGRCSKKGELGFQPVGGNGTGKYPKALPWAKVSKAFSLWLLVVFWDKNQA